MIARLLARTRSSIQSPHRTGSRAVRRGQTMVEFAMVAPLLFLILVGFFYLGSQAFNRQTMRHAGELGAAELNESLQPASLRFANNPQLTTAFLDWNTAAVNACRRPRNDTDASDYRRRLAWDWGACDATGWNQVRTALTDARNATRDRIRTPGFFIGNPNNVQIQVCLVVARTATDLRCVAESNIGPALVPTYSAASLNYYAPTYIQVVLRAPGPFTMFGWNPGTQTSYVMRHLDRFVAPCPAPRGTNNTFDYGLNGCGGQR